MPLPFLFLLVTCFASWFFSPCMTTRARALFWSLSGSERADKVWAPNGRKKCGPDRNRKVTVLRPTVVADPITPSPPYAVISCGLPSKVDRRCRDVAGKNVKKLINGGEPGLEPGTSRTLSGNHTSRPHALLICWRS